jgi:glycosyltransferase involved in cell wall biosynthesis
MKILFIKHGDNNIGSNRIWIDNYSFFFKNYFNIETKISENFEKGFDIYFISKYCKFNVVQEIRSKCNAKIGVIQPSDNNEDSIKKILLSDFLVCGSILERDYYLKFKKPSFIFPLIEIIKKNLQQKSNKTLKLGYHGNLEHLISFPDQLKSALEKLSKEINLELIVVYNKKLGNWKKPNIKISEYNWTFNTMIEQMRDVDIGLVPSLRKNNFLDRKSFLRNIFFKLTNNTKSNMINDYSIQFKNNTNAGRAFVFHQLGIPVVADFSPENFIINGNPNCGFLANSEEGWYTAVKQLNDDKILRKSISENAIKKFEEIFNPKKYIEFFISEINKF